MDVLRAHLTSYLHWTPDVTDENIPTLRGFPGPPNYYSFLVCSNLNFPPNHMSLKISVRGDMCAPLK